MELSVTSKSIRSDLDVTVVSSPLTDRASQDNVYATFNTQQCFALVVPNQDSLPLTMNFCCDIIAFGCDGTIGITEHKIPSNQGPRDLTMTPFSSGRAVVTKDLYDEQSTVLSFHPKPNKYYQFWIQTDGFVDDEAVRFENMRLNRTGFGAISMDYTAYQYDVKIEQRDDDDQDDILW